MSASLSEQIREALAAGGVRNARAPITRQGRQVTAASCSQRAIWLAQQAHPSGAYNILAGVALTGHTNLPLLTAAIELASRRHEILRTSLVLQGTQLCQVVQPDAVLKPQVLDLTGATAREAREALRSLIRAEEQHVFDLAQAPLARVLIICLPAGETALLINLHHCISDAWSQELLGQEISEAYQSLLRGQEPTLPPLTIQYADFSDWQNALITADAGSAQINYWRRLLQDAPATHGLPLEGPRGANTARSAGRLTAALEESLEELLRAFCRKHRITGFNALFALFAAAIGRFAAVDDLVLGFANANRSRPETRRLVGCLVSALPARFALSAHATFAGLAQATQAMTFEALANGDVPLERLVEALQIPRHPLIHPLFQILFEYHESGRPQSRATRSRPLEAELFGSRPAKFELLLSVADTGSGHELTWEWDSALFHESSIRHLIGTLNSLARAALQSAEAELERLPAAADSDSSVMRGPAAHFEHDPVSWFSGKVSHWQAQRPNEPAVIDGDLCLTVRELGQLSCELARQLAMDGVGEGSRVAVVMERSAAAIVALLAVQEVGAVCVPLDPHAPPARLRDMLTRGNCVYALLDSARSTDPFSAVSLAVLDRNGHRAPPVIRAAIRPPASESEPLSYIVFTSGSTGAPKGVQVSRRNVAHFLRGMQDRFGWTAGLRYSLAINLATDIGLQNVFCALAFGGTLVIVPDNASKDPREFATWMRGHPIDVAVFTPSHFCALYQPALFSTPPPRVALLLEGEALTAQMLTALSDLDANVRVANAYGPTEATMLTCIHDVDLRDPAERVPIGSPLSNFVLRVVNKHGLTQPRHAIGELWIEGPGVAHGYCGEPSLREGFDAQPDGTLRYRTGDLVRMRADGALEFLGRRDNQVKIRGHRIEPGEIEAALRETPGINLAAVRCTRAADGDGYITAYLLWHPHARHLSDSSLLAMLSQRLPAYMLPHRLISLDTLPLLANGKIDYRALPEPTDAPEPQALDPPRSGCEALLAGAWQEVLGARDIHRHSNFFSLGGNSIKVIQLVVAGRRRGLSFSAAEVHRRPVLHELARAARPAPAEPLHADPEPFSLLPAGTVAALPADVIDAYPLSRLQQAMVASHLSGGANNRYFIVSRHRAPRELRIPALIRSMELLTTALPVLRTSIAAGGSGEYLQRIHASAAVPIAVQDLQSLSRVEQERCAEARMRELRENPLPLDQPPLLRIEALQRGPEEYELIWAAHHAILDGWSIARLSEAVARLHGQIVSGLPFEPPQAQAGLARLVQREQRCAGDESERSYWQDYLSAVVPAFLPRLPEPAELAAGGIPIRQTEIPLATVQRLAAAAAACGAPLKAAFFAVYASVIGELCGTETLLTGYCTHAREDSPDGADQLGLFVRTLPVLIDLRPCSWRELILRAHDVEHTIWPHRLMPLSEIQKLAPDRAVFEHFFNFNDFYDFGRAATDVRAPRDHPLIYNVNEFALTVNVMLGRAGEPATLYVSFGPQELSEAQADSLAQLLLHGVREAARDLDAPARLCTGRIREQVVIEWNDTAQSFAGARRLHEGFLEQACRKPEAIALVDPEGCLTYGQLLLHARDIADQLAARHLARVEPVAVILPKGRAQVAAVIGILLAGGVYVPVDPAWPRARRADVLARAEVRLALAPAEEASDPGNFVEAVPVALRTHAVASPADLHTAAQVYAPRQQPDDLAYILFTSGSTGTPKGVAMEHGAVCNTLHALTQQLQLTERDRVLAVSALTFDLSVFDIFGLLGAGGAVVCPAPERGNDPAHWLDLLSTHHVTIWNTVPMTAWMLDEQLAQQPHALQQESPSIRHFLLSGDRIPTSLPAHLAQHFPGARVLSLGGATEAAIWSISYPISQDTTRWRSIPYGRPLPNQRFFILDAARRPVIPGAAGELYIAGAGLARGYYRSDEQTADAFFLHPDLGERVYRTGDYGRYLPDGQIEFIGRIDGQIKLNGYRIELGEIEAALRACAAVADAVVLVREVGARGRQLVAYLVARSNTSLDRQLVHSQLTERLPWYMIPRAIMPVPALPLSANGKVDRAQLPVPGPECFVRPEFSAPVSAQERDLAALWQTLLSLPRVGVHDNFFELGGDSILALRMIAAWGRKQRTLSLREFYAQPTIAHMIASSSERADEKAAAAAYVGEIALLPAQAWLLNRLDPRTAYFNQAVCLQVAPELDGPRIRSALDNLTARHEALRTRFQAGSQGWSARVAAEAPPAAFRDLPLEGLDAATRSRRRAELLSEAHRAIDLEKGPLLSAVHIREGSGVASLILVIAHMAVDLVSWTLLLDDLSALLQETPNPVTGAGALASWAKYLHESDTAAGFAQQSAYWAAQLGGCRTPLPLSHPEGDSSNRHLQTATLELAEWESLRKGMQEQFQATAPEWLLCIVCIALRDWTRQERVGIMVEHHGRSFRSAPPDLIRAVGWLTSLAPLTLSSHADTLADTVRALLEEIRAVPDEGVGYTVLRYLHEDSLLTGRPEPLVSFNYLGEHRTAARLGGGSAADARVLRLTADETGPGRDPEAPALFELSIYAAAQQDGLYVSIEYGELRLRRPAIDRLLRALKGTLAELHELVLQSPAARLTA